MHSLLFTVKFFNKIIEEKHIRLTPAVFIGLIAASIALIIPWLSKIFIDEILINHNMDYVLPCLLLWLVLDFIRYIGFGIRSLYSSHAVATLSVNVGLLILKKIHNCSRRIFSNYTSGDFITRINEIDENANILVDLVNEISEIAIYLFVLPFAFLMINSYLALVVGTTIVLCVFFSVVLSHYIEKWHLRKRQEEALFIKQVLSVIDNVNLIRSHSLTDTVLNEIQTRSYLINELGFRKTAISQAHKLASRLVFSSGAFLYRFLSVYLVYDGKMTIGDFFAYNTILTLLFSPIELLSSLIRPIQEMIVSSERIEEILLAPEQYRGKIELPRHGNLELKSVLMRYEEGSQPAIDFVEYVFKPGIVYGLVGANGAGKSTLLHLIARHYDLDGGSILYNGINIQEIKRDDYHSEVAHLISEGFIFPTSFMKNLVLTNNIDEQRINCIVEEFGLLNVFKRFPDNVKTLFGRYDICLSSGEKQRMNFARSIYRKHRIYLIDEALSFLDMASLTRILSFIKTDLNNCIVIIATHHLEVIRQLDCILHLEKGKLLESGSYDVLIRNGSLFKGFISN